MGEADADPNGFRIDDDRREAVWHRRQLVAAGFGFAVAGCAGRVGGGPAAGRGGRLAGIYYTVRRGDTLSAIARRSGVAVAEIRRANHLDSALIRPGQDLWLPGAQGIARDPIGELADAPPAEAEPVAGEPYALVSRSRWTDAPVKSNHYQMDGIRRITIHHTGEHKGTVGLPDREVVRRIDNYHRNGRKWAAIGYHYLIGKDGKIYEGRPEHMQGAHTRGANEHNLSISMMGDFHRDEPRGVQLRALRAFLDDTRARLGVPKKRCYGHRDLSASICPGDRLYAWLGKYKRG